MINACRSYGVGIEDESAQLAFMLAEMQNEFRNMWDRLQVVTTIADAAALVCREYERPAVLNITDRTKFGQKIYDQFHGSTPEPSPDADWIEDGIEYWESVKADIQKKIDDLRGRLK